VVTLQIHFDDGSAIRLPVSAQILLSMLEIRPGMTGVTFRKDLTFSVMQEGGRRTMRSTSHISLVGDGV
jgi:hypothetical protein